MTKADNLEPDKSKKQVPLETLQEAARRSFATSNRREPVVDRDAVLVVALVEHLFQCGARHAFGVSGGAIALLYDALAESQLNLYHFRHETGAAFAAAEAYFASQRPSLVFATTGPGTLNALTGLTAAKWDGAKVVLISGATSPAQRGRWATQETSSYTLPQDALYTKGPIFDFAVRMEHASELPEVARRLSLGIARPGGFLAHVCLPMALQSHRIDVSSLTQPSGAVAVGAPALASEDVAWCAKLLQQEPFAIWTGFGATQSADLILELVERSGAAVFCSPRAKGIVPEDHPQYFGVTGLGGHDTVPELMLQRRPAWILVLGTRLGEATSFWDPDLQPAKGFIHVDLDPEIPGTAYPECETIGIHAEIGHFLRSLLQHFPEHRALSPGHALPRSQLAPAAVAISGRRPVRPQVLMSEIQRILVDASDALILSECGNAFAWCNHYLRFPSPGRYRVSTLFGSMGHTAAGVVGAALARRAKAIAVVGDGSMLMSSEVSTAVQYQAPAVWIVLNDAAYGMCRDGQRCLGLTDKHVELPQVDFVVMACSLGAAGVQVETEDQLADALTTALAAQGPFIVDVRIDPDEASPLMQRFESLIRQGNCKNIAGWET